MPFIVDSLLRLCRFTAFILPWIISLPLIADNNITQIPIIDAPKGTVGAGFGIRAGGSPYEGIENISSIWNENNTDLVPLYLYEGKYLYSHGTSAGLHMIDREHFSFDLVARYRFDRLETDSSNLYFGMEDREQTVDGGLAFAINGNWGEVSASAVSDMLDTHNGEEYDLTYRYTWATQKWKFSPFISYVYQDEDLVNYYYGVEDDEAAPGRPAYTPGDAHFLRAGLNTSYHWSKRMRIFANFAVEGLDDPVRDSPLVDEEQLTSAFLGFAYFFGSTLDNTPDVPNEERQREWSWRVNYGYTAEETFHKVHRGYFQRNDTVDTNLAGLTVSTLLQDGSKVDYWGRFSLNRRLENDYQDDFWEYVAYVMAMGTGYSPWTEKELFRYGFGFGFSYAEEIPIVEQIKQAERENNTSHFLNYLEAQIDFPLRNLFDAKAVHNCYTGLTLVHRSGIFGSSDLLGNVSGGSDVLTVHLECKR